MWVVQEAPAPQLLRDGSGTGQGEPKTSSINYSAKVSFLRALWGRGSASRSLEMLALKGKGVL